MITFQIDDTQYYINHDKRIEEVWLFDPMQEENRIVTVILICLLLCRIAATWSIRN